VHDHRVAVGRGGEEELGVDGAGLGLQRELEVVVVVDDAAAGRERVAAEPPLEEVEDLVLAGERAGRDFGWPATIAPSSVWMNPASMVKPGPRTSCWVIGTRSYGPRW